MKINTPMKCPHCLKMVDTHKMVGGKGDYNPAPGDITICRYCSRVLEFMPDKTFKALTPSELSKIMAQEPDMAAWLLEGFKAIEKWKYINTAFHRPGAN